MSRKLELNVRILRVHMSIVEVNKYMSHFFLCRNLIKFISFIIINIYMILTRVLVEKFPKNMTTL